MRFAIYIALVCCFANAAASAVIAQQSETFPADILVDFNRDIRPILSEHCFNCHGPDANTLQAGLRLDQEQSAFAAAESGKPPVVRGDISASELINRIVSDDPNEVMPPPDFDKALSKTQIDLLRRWIEQGAKWSGHWSFKPVRMSPVPTEDLADGIVHNAIDSFVLAKLKSEGLSQSPLESRERLIRRVSLDLTGLPPSIREVEDFLADTSPNAFETVVDRLLASQHFGERLALPWLDLARYGDTSGYHNDSLRDMWLWRQWVIESFNANMPFDQFTIEQLAGDMIPGATIQQKIASGFHRNLMTSDEGGLIDSEYRNLYVVDRVATTGVTWLGMTVACAQCHDHKYDPISTEDFYKIYAFFNNVPENGKDGVRDRNPAPFLQVPTAEMEQQQQDLEKQMADVEAELASFKSSLPDKQAEWEKSLLAAEKLPEPPVPLAYFPLDADGDALGSEQDSAESRIVAEPHGEIKFADGMSGKSFDTNQETWFQYGQRFGFEKDEPFSVGTFLYVTPQGGAPFGKMDDANGARGWDVEFHGLRPSVHLIHQWPEDVIHIQSDSDVPANTFTHLAFTYDGSGKADGLKLYINGQLAKTSIKKDGLKGTIRNEIPFCVGRRGAAGTQFTGRIDDLRIYDRALEAPEVASLGVGDTYQLVKIAMEARTDEQKKRLEDFFRSTQSSELSAMESKVTSTRKTKDDFILSIPNTMVMAEMEKPRDTFIKVRGQYDLDGDKVLPGTPDFLPPIATREDGNPLNRLDFAKWLVSRDHPLTSRVTVNRWWAVLFGNGIVKTLNDFGAQGEQPTHPELLDWLAADFVRDWDTKRAIKQIVMSATYQQTSRASAESVSDDQENRRLARGPRQRLDAELIRDNALAIAGVLNPKLGGKSIKPAQPEGTWEINEMSGYKYEKSQGDELYRRGLYVYWRRSTVYPSFVTLDAPTREFCVSQRAKTSTPLQSLVLMNDPVFVEAARAFAQRILSAPDLDDAGRIRLAWQVALSRVPTEAEFAILQGVLQQQQTTYQADAESAAKLLTVGDIARIDKVSDSDLAAWTAFCNVILNLNETISN